MALVQQVVNIIEAVSGAPGAEDCSDNCLSATVASQLKICFLCANFGLNETDIISVVDHLVVVWWSLRRRGVSHFGHATHGFIKYISYSSAKICNHGLADSDFEPLKQKAGSYTLRATLYVLHILLIYGAELKFTLEPALSTVPLSPTMAGSNSRIVCSVKFSSPASGSEAVGGLTNDAGQAISLVHCLPNTS